MKIFKQTRNRMIRLVMTAAVLLLLAGAASEAKAAEITVSESKKASEITVTEADTLKIDGEVTITMDKDLACARIFGYSGSKLTVDGAGKLTVRSADDLGDGAVDLDEFYVKNGNVEVSTDKMRGIYVYTFGFEKSTVSVNTKGTDKHGIWFVKGQNVITDSVVTVETDDADAVTDNFSSSSSGLKCTGSELEIVSWTKHGIKVKSLECGNTKLSCNANDISIWVQDDITITGETLDIISLNDDAVYSEDGNVTMKSCSGKIKGSDYGVRSAHKELTVDSCKDLVIETSEYAGLCAGSGLNIVDSGLTVSTTDYNVIRVFNGPALIKGGSISMSLPAMAGYEAVLTPDIFTLQGAEVTISAGNGPGIDAKEFVMDSGKLSINVKKNSKAAIAADKITLADELYVKTPEYGKANSITEGAYSGRTCIVDAAGKVSNKAEILGRTYLKEIHFEFDEPLEGKPIATNMKITTVPENAVFTDNVNKAFAVSLGAGDLLNQSDDGKTYKKLVPEGTFTAGKYYATQEVTYTSLLLGLALGTDNPSPEKIYDRNLVQGLAKDAKIFVNGKQITSADIFVKGSDTTLDYYPLGACRKDISKCTVTAVPDQEYSGAAITPALEIKSGDTVLKADTDYTLVYKDNTAQGKASVEITGIGAYYGSNAAAFNIVHTVHVMDEGIITKEAGETTEGVKTFSCSICGTVMKTEAIPAIGTKLKTADKAIQSVTGYKEAKNSTFGVLQARAKKVGKNYVTLSWTKVKGASGYIIYGNKCSKKTKYVKLATINSGKTVTKKITKIAKKKLTKGTYYKFIIAALKKDAKGTKRVIATSKSIHIITAGNAAYGDYTKVKVSSKKSVTVKVGKTSQIKATPVKAKKLKVKEHRGLCYESADKKIATVSKKGVIKGKKAGKTTIYVYAQNGVFAKINVTVK